MQISNKEPSQKIIICADEKEFALFYGEVLGLQYNIITTTNGKECIDKYNELH